MYAADGRLLYVGKAKDLAVRLRSYLDAGRLSARIAKMVSEVARVELAVVPTESQALVLEQDLIKRLRPKYNILLRDDKSYPFLVITRGAVPRLGKYRGARNKSAHFFGPFPDGTAVAEAVRILEAAFRLRTCRDSIFANRSRPCLLWQIKKCSAPCCGKISSEDYEASVRGAVEFLKGKNPALLETLGEKMQEAAEAHDYEAAIALRDQISSLSQVLKVSPLANIGESADVVALARAGEAIAIEVMFSRNFIITGDFTYFVESAGDANDPEIIGEFLESFYSEREAPKVVLTNIAGVVFDGAKVEVPTSGVKAEAVRNVVKNGEAKLERRLLNEKAAEKYLAELQELLGLATPIERIDVFDNSHISGSFKVGAVISAGARGFIKNLYRKYDIKSTEVGDDFAMMREVLTRRLTRCRDEGALPSLVMIDGGEPQMRAARTVLSLLDMADLPLLGFAKTEGHDAGNETLLFDGRRIKLPEGSALLFYLERIRDEAHRFAIGAHRSKRGGELVRSVLDEIEGVGAARKKALLLYFGSAKNVLDAGVDELMKVRGISRDTAEKIYRIKH